MTRAPLIGSAAMLALAGIGGAALAPPAAAQTRIDVPPPPSAVAQAKAQATGDYGVLLRGVAGGQIQDAWDRSDLTAGVYRYAACGSCVYKVRTRERMVTGIELPAGETIAGADIGDSGLFEVEIRAPRVAAVKPLGQGVDTSLLIYGSSGRIYPFYLRAEGFNSTNVPDLLVRVVGAPAPDGPGLPGIDAAGAGGTETGASGAERPSRLPPARGEDIAALAEALRTKPPAGEPAAEDFAARHPFDPDKLRGWGDYELWGSEELRPETVFRDDDFTYIKFGDRWTDLELPTAYVVVDGIDELVNTRVAGTTFIVESTRKLISLKSGKKYLCIQYTGEGR